MGLLIHCFPTKRNNTPFLSTFFSEMDVRKSSTWAAPKRTYSTKEKSMDSSRGKTWMDWTTSHTPLTQYVLCI